MVNILSFIDLFLHKILATALFFFINIYSSQNVQNAGLNNARILFHNKLCECKVSGRKNTFVFYLE